MRVPVSQAPKTTECPRELLPVVSTATVGDAPRQIPASSPQHPLPVLSANLRAGASLMVQQSSRNNPYKPHYVIIAFHILLDSYNYELC